MAASGGSVLVEDSSSEDEDLEKFREAAWSFGPASTNGTQQSSAGGDGEAKPSRRVQVSQHEHDGNELQTTPEFRAHVAKKLVAMLDSCISVGTSPGTINTSTVLPARGKDNDDEDVEEEGFRLFSTSVPGLPAKQPTAPRRPIPSSSDSDSEMEMRLREAAVSVADLLPPSVLASKPQSLASPAPPSAEKKKKKKKKKRKEESEVGERRVEEESKNGTSETKKKKKRKLTEGGAQESEMETNSQNFLHSKKKVVEEGSSECFSPKMDSTQQPEEATVKIKKKKKKTAGDG